MSKIIFRNDDVTCNTSFIDMYKIYIFIRESFSNSEIWSANTVFSKKSKGGSVYPDLPLKNKHTDYFFDVDDYRFPSQSYSWHGEKIVSHGLWHFDHTTVHQELQKASIITSCKLLDTNIFVPPFNQWDTNTEEICKENKIKLIKYEDGWKSLEHNEFNPDHKLWYFHSWKWTPEKFKEHILKSNVCV